MTDEDIGRTVREIVDLGYNAIVKKSKNGIIILKEKCEIVLKDNMLQNKKL